MPQPRRTAWALIASLLATIAFSAGSGVALAANQAPTVGDPATLCSPGHMPTKWGDELHPPQTVRVLRSKGPNAGRVEQVPFREYTAVVLRAEYSTGQDKPPLWMRIGAITVKQYGWWKAMFWGGGRITFTNPDSSTTTSCYDLKDTTADQIYKPQQTGPGGTVYPGSIPTAANYKAIDETWHMTIRKWMTDKLKSRLFLTGYRSGLQKPCGADSTGFKILQKSLRDCYVKNMNLEETLREYFEPNLLIVDSRGHDVLSDGGAWRGDFGVLSAGSGSSTAWKLYAASADSFSGGASQTFSGVDFSGVRGQGVGDVDGDRLADLVMLTNGGSKLQVAKANGNGLAAPNSVDVPQTDRLLVADFDGDLQTDAGLLRLNGGQGSLTVMRGLSTGAFGAAANWWTGPLATQDVVMAGDTNGDGKADLIIRDATSGVYQVAASVASCSNLTAWGLCPSGAVGAAGLGASSSWLSTASWDPVDVKSVVGDYNRDGRDDVISVVQEGSAVKVYGLASKLDGTFAAPALLWQQASTDIDDLMPVAMNVNADGLADVAFVQKDGSNTKVFWLKSVERSASPASMTAGPIVSDSLSWSTGNKAF
jgi:hypothetical protein